MNRQTHTTRSRHISRRQILAALPAFVWAPRTITRVLQSPPPAIPVQRLHSFGLRVSDVEQTLDFYQGLFGMPVQSNEDDAVCLRIGDGPQFLSVSPKGPNETPGISHICLSSPGFDVDTLTGALTDLGLTQMDPPESGSRGIDNPMKFWVRVSGNNTPLLYFSDARGLVIQLQDPAYCGGGGPLGSECMAPEPAPSAGRIALGDLNHFTVFISDGNGAIDFYQEAMGFAPQAYQATTPALGVGDGNQFLMFVGGGGGRGRGGGANPPATPANIHHASFNMDGFDVGKIEETLSDYGLSAGTSNTGPLVHYVSLRMPNRGGAEGGTPELYFTDPDGLLMQIQDSTYCGGGGILGNVCELPR